MTVWGTCQYILLTVVEIIKENSYTLAKKKKDSLLEVKQLIKINHVKVVDKKKRDLQ